MTDTSAMQNSRTFDPEQLERQAMYFLLNSVVVPRPIAWVASMGADGCHNLAPHSYFTVASVAPPVIAFVSIGDKDTLKNVRVHADFTVNMVGHSLAERMNVTAADAPSNVSEFELAGLTEIAGEVVDCPRVAEAAVSIECSREKIVEIGDGRMIFGAVRRVHVHEQVFNEKDRVDPGLLDAIGRMGGSAYATTRDRFELRRPKYEDVK